MKVKDALSLIDFATKTVHDLSGKTVNKLFTNKQIVEQFKFALDRYAQFTKAIQAIYSLPLVENVRTVDAPADVIRSEGYRFILVWVQGRKYPIDINNLNRTQTEFPYDTYNDIPRWILPWEKELYIYPKNLNSFQSTELTARLKNNDTTITVASTNAFPPEVGRITIGDEKIRYKRKTDTQFIDCIRGIEGTTPTAHAIGTEVKENNFVIYYYKKHFPIRVDDSDVINQEDADREMEVEDEHVENIVDATAYKLIKKVDAQRAAAYKFDYETWLQKAKEDIQKGRSEISKGAMIRDPYDWENEYAHDVWR
jgi:predicted DNA-binding protein (UPF0251 family)